MSKRLRETEGGKSQGKSRKSTRHDVESEKVLQEFTPEKVRSPEKISVEEKAHKSKTRRLHHESRTHQNDLEQRLSVINDQNKSLESEDQRISKLRSINREANIREEKEYQAILAEIEEAKAYLEDLKKQAKAVDRASQEAKKSYEKTQKELESRKAKLAQLKTEEKRLIKLEKQSKEELKSIQQDEMISRREEAAVVEVERSLAEKEKQLSKLRKTVEEKQTLVDQKNAKIMHIMAESDSIGRKLDAEVKRAEETAHAMSYSEEESSAEVPEPPKKFTASTKPKLNPFAMFKRTNPIAGPSDSSNSDSENSANNTLEQVYDNSGEADTPIPYKRTKASPYSMPASDSHTPIRKSHVTFENEDITPQKNSNEISSVSEDEVLNSYGEEDEPELAEEPEEDIVSDEPANEEEALFSEEIQEEEESFESSGSARITALMKRTEKNVSPMKTQQDVVTKALEALEMEVADAEDLRDRVESVTGDIRTRSHIY